MKKSELKLLLKVITEEVIAAKTQQLNESKGLSGFKETKDSSEHTENIADSKDLTGKGPVEKTEGKKLPVVKKPTTPQKIGNLKEEIMEMIREAIEEAEVDEIRKPGSIGSKFKVKDPSSPTGWSIKGHKTIPDGTPTEAPKGPYQATRENPNLGRPKKAAPLLSTNNQKTKDAIENILTVAPATDDNEIIKQIVDLALTDETINTDPVFVKTASDEIRQQLASEKTTTDQDISPEEMGRIEKANKEKKMSNLRAYLMRKRGIKPN